LIVSQVLGHSVVVAGLAQAVARDTVVAVPAHNGWEWVQVATSIAQIVIALALILIGLVTIAICLLLWKLYRKMGGIAEKLRLDLDPVVKNAITASESTRGMVEKVQGNVAEISRTVSTANERIGRVVESAERRAADLNALLDVAQEEAESLFIRTVSTLRGAAAGAGALRGGHGPRRGEPLDHEISDEELEIRIEARDGGQPPRIR